MGNGQFGWVVGQIGPEAGLLTKAQMEAALNDHHDIEPKLFPAN